MSMPPWMVLKDDLPPRMVWAKMQVHGQEWRLIRVNYPKASFSVGELLYCILLLYCISLYLACANLGFCLYGPIFSCGFRLWSPVSQWLDSLMSRWVTNKINFLFGSPLLSEVCTKPSQPIRDDPIPIPLCWMSHFIVFSFQLIFRNLHPKLRIPGKGYQ